MTKPDDSDTASLILDEMFLDEIIEIDEADGNTIAREIIDMYLQDSRKYVEDVRQSVSRRSAAELAVTAHALKSMSISLGGRALGQLCHKLEVAGRTSELSSITQDMTQLDDHYLKLIDALTNYRDSRCPPAAVSGT